MTTFKDSLNLKANLKLNHAPPLALFHYAATYHKNLLSEERLKVGKF